MLARNPRYYGGGHRRFNRAPRYTMLLVALGFDFGVLLAVAGVTWAPVFTMLATFALVGAPAALRRARHG
jgi:hypothetical protein